MSATVYNLSVEQNATYALTVTAQDSTGSAINLTGYTIYCGIRLNYGDTPIIGLVQNTGTSLSGIKPTALSSGKFQIYLVPFDTLSLSPTSPATHYFYDVFLTNNSDGSKIKLIYGSVFVSPAYTQLGTSTTPTTPQPSGSVPYISSNNVVAYLAPSTAGYVLSSNGTGNAPSWIAPSWISGNSIPITATGSTTPRTLANRFADVTNVLDFGAKGDGVTDDTAAIQNALNSASSNGNVCYFPSGKYKITNGLTYVGTGGGIYMESVGYGAGGTNDNGIYPIGSGYTALTISGSFASFNVCLGGSGQTLNGIVFNSPQNSITQKIRVYNFNGFGVRINKCYDCLFSSISVELCGNTTYYAFSMNGDGDTCNMTHILRLQVEQANAKAIFIDSNTLSSVIDNIHSERANAVSGYITWYLGGDKSTYNTLRMEANNPSIATINISATWTTYINLLVEGGIPISWQAISGSEITIINPILTGNVSEVSDQTGTINIFGGNINSLSLGVYGYRVYGTQIATLSVGYSVNKNPAFAVFNGCNILTLLSTSTTASATFTDCIVSECNSLLQGNTNINGGSFTTATTLTPAYNQIINTNNTIISASAFSFGSNVFINSKGTVWNGGMSFSSLYASLFDDSSYVNGSVTGFTYPTSNNSFNFYKGQYTKNISPAVGSPKGWMCTVAGTSGTWVSMGNL